MYTTEVARFFKNRPLKTNLRYTGYVINLRMKIFSYRINFENGFPDEVFTDLASKLQLSMFLTANLYYIYLY
ncbi:hypothetical protein RG963_07695 [Methanosarcina sp. Z-7115]|uniref:Mobile element protein n=1 Tax=Methanosarcina baikalica TaxID=3073890 RepID=A0ABU2D102_9EURY|nr:hypothetical protein [Methanosarcina sp. Z-7115]MDR7665658.1 hypothetical protein [Methanosarcina sp. Z-7115]